MRCRPLRAIMLSMTRPITSSKILLVACRRDPSFPEELAPVRRYRLARVALDGRTLSPQLRPGELRPACD